MNKTQALRRIAEEIKRCRLCKKGGTGKAVPGEGNPNARVVFIGEAPGKEEALSGRPFVGRSGKLLRGMLHESGFVEQDFFITSPAHYLPLRGTPSKAIVVHGRKHLYKQLDIIKPQIIVLLGNTACFAMLDTPTGVSRTHGKTIKKEGKDYFITFHPAYVLRFPKNKKRFANDLKKIRSIIEMI